MTSVKENGTLKLRYTYDNLGQLTREDNAYAGKTYVYTYDNGGNILTKKTYAYTTGTVGKAVTISVAVSWLYNDIGCIGVFPSTISVYLRSNFWSVRPLGANTKLWKINADLSGAVIILYRLPKLEGLHHVAGISTGTSGNKFRFYNDSLVFPAN